jgi:TonB family protein
MTKRVVVHTILSMLCTLASVHLAAAQRGSRAYESPRGGAAMDLKGRWHSAREYPNGHAPWNFADQITAVAPHYSFEDRAQRNQGQGVFHVLVDPKTGAVTQVTILTSTGHGSLDAAAIRALRRWRWKPSTWKELMIPVRFVMARDAPKEPQDAIRISR